MSDEKKCNKIRVDLSFGAMSVTAYISRDKSYNDIIGEFRNLIKIFDGFVAIYKEYADDWYKDDEDDEDNVDFKVGGDGYA